MEALDFSRTKRIVFLIDLHPIFALTNPDRYLTSVLISARKLLSFPPLSSSLFAHSLFFSSLSPILSTSKIHRLLGKSATFLSFDRPSQALDSLSRTLNSLSAAISDTDDAKGLSLPRATLTAGSLFQLAYNCPWELPIDESKGMDGIFAVRSNLVLMLSPLPRALKGLSEFLDVGILDDFSLNLDSLCTTFFQIFGPVNELFASKDVYCSWIDIISDEKCCEGMLGFVEKGIRGLGFGFCSTDTIVLGSALIPFGLIYPYIGCALGSGPIGDLEKGRADLSLEIIDVSGKPLECKCCDLEVLDLKKPREMSDILVPFSRDFENAVEIHIKQVWRIDEGAKIEATECGLLLLRGFSKNCKDDKNRDNQDDLFADKVIELVCEERSEYIAGKPVWQLILAFLYNRSYWALISVSSKDGNSLTGILKPFTLHSAVLCITDSMKMGGGLFELSGSLNGSNVVSVSEHDCSKEIDSKRKINKKNTNLLHQFTWSKFCKLAFSRTSDIGLGMDLEEIYFSKERKSSKKLRFLQCWMRQIKNSRRCSQTKLNGPEEKADAEEETEERVVNLQQDTEPPVSSSTSTGAAYFDGYVIEEALLPNCMEDSESFIGSISQTIERCLCSEDVDLGFLAERLVRSAVQFFSVKFINSTRNDLIPEEADDSYQVEVAAEVSKLILKKPKDLAAKYKGCNPSSLASSQTSDVCSAEKKVREHELQILLRMEILESKVGLTTEGDVWLKMAKEICSLLNNIDFDLQGGISESLIEFAGRTIKDRYAHCLGDVIQRIYTQMEFLFDKDDGEDTGSLPNSSNNDELLRDKEDDNDICRDAVKGNLQKSTCQNSRTGQGKEKDAKSLLKNTDNVEKHRLVKAKERRERARRFSHFTSGMQNLQRVWAPKQLKSEKPLPDFFHKTSEKRKWYMTRNDMVCETPMTGKQLRHIEDGGSMGKHSRIGTSSHVSLSRALFHNEGDSGV